MENLKKLYEVRKTVRFELRPSKKKIFEGGNIVKLQKDFEEVQKNFLDLFIYDSTKESTEKDGKIISQYTKIEFKKKREIKYTWLRTYTKNEFYDWDKKSDTEKNYALNKIEFLEKENLRWFNEWQELTENLKDLIQTKEHEKERKSDTAFVLRKFLKRQNFPFVKDFFNAVVDVQGKQGNESDEKIREFREELKEIEKNLNTCAREYLPTQSNGVLLHKASFNYYTLNKTPKEYETLKTQKELEMNHVLPKDIYKRTKFNQQTKIKEVLFECSKDWFKKIRIDMEAYSWKLDKTYREMKIWKADQKSDFIKTVAGDKLKPQSFREKFPLFNTSDENFKTFYKLTKELDKKPENAKNIAQKRGKFFNAPREKVQTQDYFELCELYKRIAVKRGKIIAEIKGIENEEVQSQLLTHWAVVAEERGKRSIVFIPRKKNEELENHKKAHEFLQKQEKKEFGDIKIYHFKSLTLRALEKLCFKEIKNTFAPEIMKETNPKIWFPKYKQEWNNQPEKLIGFYKQVLQSKYSQTYLDLVNFGNLKTFIETDFTTLEEEFESKLEKTCYVKVPVYFSKEEFKNFADAFDAEVFEITARGISSESKRKENAHAEIWKDFWSKENEEKNHITRLNPEVSVFYRDEVKEKSNTLRENNKSNINNRFSAPRFTLATTITLRATNKKSNLAFKTVEDIKSHINDFNEEFNKNFSGEWVYGIDRGLKELATFNVVKFSDEKNEFGVSQPKEFAKIPVYKLKNKIAILKDDNGEDLKNARGDARKVIDNISEVLEEGKEPDSKLFEKQEVSSIDLTQAKLIKGHIISNGDQKTYLKLKETSAKRRIFELFSTSRIDKNSVIKKTKEKILINCQGVSREIYNWKDFEKPDQNHRNRVRDGLEGYLKDLDEKNRFENIEQLEKINYLRDAITANMVGILFHLQNKLGMKGIIALENLDVKKKETLDILDNGRFSKEETGKEIKMIDEHFKQSNENISRRLEWALYRKFANTGEVPPQIQESIFLRDEFKVYQMGILKFVEVGGTSSNCPKCNQKSGKTNGHFVCKVQNNCGFSSKENKENRDLLEQNLHNSDEVAAYNIAKQGFGGEKFTN